MNKVFTAVEVGVLLIIVGILALVVVSVVYTYQDNVSGKTVMGLATVVDKEHEITTKDDNTTHAYYFVVTGENGHVRRASVSVENYRMIPVGNKVIVDTRIGGLSKEVVEETVRPFEGAEAK